MQFSPFQLKSVIFSIFGCDLNRRKRKDERGEEKKGLIKIKGSLGVGWCFLESQFNTTKLIQRERERHLSTLPIKRQGRCNHQTNDSQERYAIKDKREAALKHYFSRTSCVDTLCYKINSKDH